MATIERYDPNRHHRRSVRLRGYDYTAAGAYFVTICTLDRLCWLATIEDGAAILTPAGQIVGQVWRDLPAGFPGLGLDACVVMPNHVHGVLVVTSVGAQFIAPSQEGAMNCAPTRILPDRGAAVAIDTAEGRRFHTTPREVGARHAGGWTIGEVVRAFKAASARRIRTTTIPAFAWQRSYYEHIVRDDRSLERIRDYIATNPQQWERDQLNPANSSKW